MQYSKVKSILSTEKKNGILTYEKRRFAKAKYHLTNEKRNFPREDGIFAMKNADSP